MITIVLKCSSANTCLHSLFKKWREKAMLKYVSMHALARGVIWWRQFYVNMISLMQFSLIAEWRHVTEWKARSPFHFHSISKSEWFAEGINLAFIMPRNSAKSDKSTVTSACGNLQQYCLNSSLHGLKYCGTSALTAFERIFFGISFAIVMVLAAYFISNIWQKWQQSPVIVSGNPSFTKIQVRFVRTHFLKQIFLRSKKILIKDYKK